MKKHFSPADIFYIALLMTITAFVITNPVFADAKDDAEALLKAIRNVVSITSSAVGVVITFYGISQWYMAFRSDNGEQQTQAGYKMVVGIMIIVMPRIISSIFKSLSMSRQTVKFAVSILNSLT